MCIFYSLHLLFNELKIEEDENGNVAYGKRNCKLLLLGGLIYIIIYTILKEKINNKAIKLYTEKSCGICLEEYNLENDIIVSLPCGHIFHKECKEILKDNECPICRKSYS